MQKACMAAAAAWDSLLRASVCRQWSFHAVLLIPLESAPRGEPKIPSEKYHSDSKNVTSSMVSHIENNEQAVQDPVPLRLTRDIRIVCSLFL